MQVLKAERAAFQEAAGHVTLASLNGMLATVYREARAAKQFAPAAQAAMGMAKLNGFLVDRIQLDAIVRKPSASPDSPDEMTPEAWMDSVGLMIEHQPAAGSAPTTGGEVRAAGSGGGVDAEIVLTKSTPAVEAETGRSAVDVVDAEIVQEVDPFTSELVGGRSGAPIIDTE